MTKSAHVQDIEIGAHAPVEVYTCTLENGERCMALEQADQTNPQFTNSILIPLHRLGELVSVLKELQDFVHPPMAAVGASESFEQLTLFDD